MADLKGQTAIMSTGNSYRVRLVAFSLLFAGAICCWQQPKVLANSCSAEATDPDLRVDDAIDVRAVDIRAAIARMLRSGSFDELDCVADSVRASKEKFAGGMWKLHVLYGGLESPSQHATEEDWKNHLKQLKRWVAQNPHSITANIALAEAYLSYAWDARGHGETNSVSDSGWKLFAERSGQAKKILDKASTLKDKCPEWYAAMESVAMAQSWKREDARALVEKLKSSEPDYYYVYRLHATYLLPKWYGEEGDSESFAASIADEIGGQKGDEAYFQIAGFLVCDCEYQPLNHMTWPRIQSGFADIEKQHGRSLTNLNLLARMAVKLKDPVVAEQAFRLIGEQWSEATWRTQAYFESARTWASQTAPQAAGQRMIEGEADRNLRAEGGLSYQTAFDNKFESFIQECMKTTGTDRQAFEMLIQVGERGTIERLMTNPSTNVSDCLFQKLVEFQMAKTAAFPRPPRPSYWVRVNLDPAALHSDKAEAQ